MTITIMMQEEIKLWEENLQNNLQILSQEPWEKLCEIPQQLGSGYGRRIAVHPELSLTIYDYKYHDEVLLKIPEMVHPVQFSVCLSGFASDSFGQIFGGKHTMISGSGVQRKMTVRYPKSQHIVIVDIELSPDLLRTFFPGEDGDLASELRFLVKGNDWQTLIYPETNPGIHGVAQQIVNCSMQGILKRIVLQGKIQELMALQLAPILMDRGRRELPGLKAGTIARIHHAKDLLLMHLENPPSVLELAKRVGISDRTLRRGFQELFGMAVIDFLTRKRMERAEQLLRETRLSVAEVTNIVGYANQSHFAAVFKRQFGITPTDCVLGKLCD